LEVSKSAAAAGDLVQKIVFH